MITLYAVRELFLLCTGIGSVLSISSYKGVDIGIGIGKEKM